MNEPSIIRPDALVIYSGLVCLVNLAILYYIGMQY